VTAKKTSTKTSEKKPSTKEPASPAKQSEPQSMDELMALYGGGFKQFAIKDNIKATVTSIEKGRVLLDIGGKTQGLVAEKAYKLAEDYIKTLKVGDIVEGVVLVPETRDGYTILSLKQAAQKVTWEKIDKAYQSGKPIEVEGKAVNPSGVVVDVEGLTGFVPTSQLGHALSAKPQDLVGKKFEAVVIDFDKDQNKVVLSEKEVSEAEEIGMQRDAMKEISDGQEFEGEVMTIYDFGAFIKIDAPIGKGKKSKTVPLEGLVHISELSFAKVDKPEDVVKVGDKVKVKVIGKRNNKLALSIKQMKDDPWMDVNKKYAKDKKVEGKVVKVSDFGVFVSLEPGIEGLIHITKIPPTQKFEVGDDVNVTIEEIDTENKKLSLGLVLTAKPIGYK